MRMALSKAGDRAMSDVIEKRAYTVEEVATILSCCTKTVRKLCKEGKLRSVDLGPRAKRIPREALDDYMSGKVEN